MDVVAMIVFDLLCQVLVEIVFDLLCQFPVEMGLSWLIDRLLGS